MITANILFELFMQAGIDDPNTFNHFMILGYVAMWIIAMVYILSLANRQRNVKEEVELLRQLLEEDEEDTNR